MAKEFEPDAIDIDDRIASIVSDETETTKLSL